MHMIVAEGQRVSRGRTCAWNPFPGGLASTAPRCNGPWEQGAAPSNGSCRTTSASRSNAAPAHAPGGTALSQGKMTSRDTPAEAMASVGHQTFPVRKPTPEVTMPAPATSQSSPKILPTGLRMVTRAESGQERSGKPHADDQPAPPHLRTHLMGEECGEPRGTAM